MKTWRDYPTIRTTLSPDEMKAYRHKCLESDTTMGDEVTKFVRKQLRTAKNKSIARVAELNDDENNSDTDLTT
jgi:hypothetical protein